MDASVPSSPRKKISESSPVCEWRDLMLFRAIRRLPWAGMNQIALEYIGHPRTEALVEEYRAKIAGE